LQFGAKRPTQTGRESMQKTRKSLQSNFTVV
jgi:hypothetical protein